LCLSVLVHVLGAVD